MKIIQVSTHGNYGGAGIACDRISNAINSVAPQSSKVFCSNNEEGVFFFFRKKPFPSLFLKFNLLMEIIFLKLCGIIPFWQFSFTPAQFGIDLLNWDGLRKADIINLHWINGGFISIKGLNKLALLKKPIFWTLHDMWTMTGGCHHAGNCQNYYDHCGNCPMFSTPKPQDLSLKLNKEKFQLYQSLKPVIICPSRWLMECARKSTLLRSFPIYVIPNPIDTNTYKPGNRSRKRLQFQFEEDEFILVTNAYKIFKPMKGFSFLLKALEILKIRSPYIFKQIRLVLIGEIKESEKEALINYKVDIMGYISDYNKIIDINQAADVYISPSLEENLPNTILEALSCGLPSIAFKVGGIPDLIEHRFTGYLADEKSPEDLSNGIEWVYKSLKESDFLKINSRDKALKEFDNDKVALDYLNLYHKHSFKDSNSVIF